MSPPSPGANSGAARAIRSVHLILYDGVPVAAAGATRYLLTIDAYLSNDLCLFVACMAAFALEVRWGAAPGPYTQERAELFARLVLIDDQELSFHVRGGAHLRYLAGHFGVPLEQLLIRMDELGLR